MNRTPDPAQYVRRMRPLLGTFVEVASVSFDAAERAMDAAFAAIERVQQHLSFHDPRSALSQLNASAGQWLPLPASALRVLAAALAFTRLSNGLFNCTVGGELVQRGVLPDHGGGAGLPRGEAADVEIVAGQARLLRPVRITLDGFAKGWAVDRAVSALRAAGARSGWVNAGGDLRVFGDLLLPVARREIDGTLRQLGGLRDAALATSAARRTADNEFPGLIVGESVQVGVWSVVARFAWRADALTKVAANAPDDAREAIIARLGGQLVGPLASA